MAKENNRTLDLAHSIINADSRIFDAADLISNHKTKTKYWDASTKIIQDIRRQMVEAEAKILKLKAPISYIVWAENEKNKCH